MSMTTDVNGRQLSIIDTYQINLSDEEHDLSDIRQMSFLDNCPVGWFIGDRCLCRGGRSFLKGLASHC